MQSIPPIPYRTYLHHESDGVLVYSANNVLLLVGVGQPVANDHHMWFSALDALYSRWPQGIGVLFCATSTARPSDRANRELVMRNLRHPAVRAIGCAVLGSGFVPAAVRSVLSTVLIGLPAPSKVFGEVPPCAEWLVKQLTGLREVTVNHHALARTVLEIVDGRLADQVRWTGT